MTMLQTVGEVPARDAGKVNLFVIKTARELELLRGEWNELFETSPTAAPPLRFEWVNEWWRVYGPVYGDNSKGLRIITLRRDGKLIGVLPLYESAGMLGLRRLRFISSGAAEFEET